MKQYWNGALSGLLAGLAIGFLTAPQAGKETCQKLADTLDDKTSGFAAGLKELRDKARLMADELMDNAKAEAGVFAHKAKKTVDVYQANATHQKTDTRYKHQVI